MSAVDGACCGKGEALGDGEAPVAADRASSAGEGADAAAAPGSALRSRAAWYVLVSSHTEGLGLYRRLRSAGFAVRIAPVPHGLQACCGMSVLVGEAEVDAVRAFMDRENCPYEDVVRVEHAIDAGRDRFC